MNVENMESGFLFKCQDCGSHEFYVGTSDMENPEAEELVCVECNSPHPNAGS